MVFVRAVADVPRNLFLVGTSSISASGIIRSIRTVDASIAGFYTNRLPRRPPRRRPLSPDPKGPVGLCRRLRRHLPFHRPAQGNAPQATHDRLGPLVHRMQSNPEFVAEQRRWLGAYQAGSARKYFAERRREWIRASNSCRTLRGRINSALKGAGKSKGTMHLIGCPIAELKAHLEKQFAPGMTRSNYGEWHVDHIVPCRSFDLRRPDDQHRCFHFTNLQLSLGRRQFLRRAAHPNP